MESVKNVILEIISVCRTYLFNLYAGAKDSYSSLFPNFGKNVVPKDEQHLFAHLDKDGLEAEVGTVADLRVSLRHYVRLIS